MEDLILDNTDVKNNYSIHPLKYICIGVFLWLSISSLSYLVRYITRNLLFYVGTEAIVIFSTTLAIEIITLTMLLIYAARKIRKEQINTPSKVKRTFIIAIITFVMAQVLLFFSTYFLEHLFTDTFIETMKTYNDFSFRHNMIEATTDVLQYIIAGALLWRAT